MYVTHINFMAAGEDYIETMLTLDIFPNATQLSARIPILNDVLLEGLELFSVELNSSSDFVFIERSVAIVQVWISMVCVIIQAYVISCVL